MNGMQDAGESLFEPQFDMNAATPAEAAAFQARQLGNLFESGFRPMTHWTDLVRTRLAKWRKKEAEGRSTGLRTLDNVVRLINGSLILIAARPSVGKTILAMQIAENVAGQLLKEGDPGVVAVFSAEMTGDDLAVRMASALSGADAHRLRMGKGTDQEYADFNDTLDRIEELPIWIDDATSPSTRNMMDGLMKIVQTGTPVRAMVFDYVELAGNRNNRSEEQRIGEIAVQLKAIAKALQIPVISATQLNRECEKTQGKMPALEHLRQCVPGNTRVRLADGRVVRADSVQDGDKLLTLNANLHLIASAPVKAWRVGEKPVYRLRTRTGREIVATGNHPFLRYDGWTPLEQLSAGQEIAVPRRLPLGDDLTLSAAEMRLIGYLIGDGSYKRLRSVEFVNSEIACIEDVRELAEAVFPIRVKDKQSACGKYRWLALTGEGKGPGSSPAIEWVKRLGIHGQEAINKRIPEAAKQSPYIAELLSGLILTDGSIGRFGSGGWKVKYSTNSFGLAMDVQEAMLRLGVVAHLAKPEKKGRYNPMYNVIVTGGANVARLLSFVRLVGYKAEIAQAALQECLAPGSECGHTDRLPLEVNTMILSAKQDLGLSWKALGYRVQGRRIGRERASVVAERIGSPALARLAASDVLWDEIVSIEPEGMEAVYDICVPGTENFIANDIVVHNSGMLEQAADLVLFIMRPEIYLKAGQSCYIGLEEDRKGTAFVHIGKNRHGPRGDTYRLYFDGARSRFGDLVTPFKLVDAFKVAKPKKVEDAEGNDPEEGGDDESVAPR